MADKFINETGLRAIKTWIEGKFATITGLNTLSGRVDQIIAEGGEPNVIETVKVNGTALTPDANKAVDVTVPTTVAELTDASDYALASDIPTKVSDLTNDGDGTQGSAFATEDYVDENGGKIDKIKVNGTEQTITNKAVDISVPTTVAELSDASDYALAADIPTNVSDLTNDSGYQTASDVESAIDTALTSAMTYKGSVATYADLPSSGNKVGDFYNVQADGKNYAWDGSAWDDVGGTVDLSALWTSTAGQSNTLLAMTVSEINAILEPSA